MSYWKFGAVIVDQLFSYQDANLLLSSVDTIADNLGILDGDTDGKIRQLRTDGPIYFNGGTAVKIERTSTTFKVTGANFNIGSGRIYPQSVMLHYKGDLTGVPVFLGAASASYQCGHRPHTNGQIVGYSFAMYVTSYVGTAGATSAIRIYANGNLVTTGATLAHGSPPERLSDCAVVAGAGYGPGDIEVECYTNVGFPGAAIAGKIEAFVEVLT